MNGGQKFGGKETEEWPLQVGTRFLFGATKNILELDGGGNCTTPNTIKATLKEGILWHVNCIACCYKKLRNLPKFTKYK